MANWTSLVLRVSKTVVLGLLVLVTSWFLYRLSTRALKSVLGAPQPQEAAAPSASADFDTSDQVQYSPAPGSVVEVTSDRTVDAILSGAFGPHVVLVYADWCTHCRNMTDAYEAAAKMSKVPFVKIQGAKAIVTGRKHMVAGYPTVFGVANVGGPPRRYASARTPEAFVEFATALAPSLAAAPVVAALPEPVVAAPEVVTVVPEDLTTAQVAMVAPSVELLE